MYNHLTDQLDVQWYVRHTRSNVQYPHHGMPRLCRVIAVRCYTEKAREARRSLEQQYSTRANCNKQCRSNKTKPYSNATQPHERQSNPTNGYTHRGALWSGIFRNALLVAGVFCFYCLLDCSFCWFLGVAGNILPSQCYTMSYLVRGMSMSMHVMACHCCFTNQPLSFVKKVNLWTSEHPPNTHACTKPTCTYR